MLSERTQVLLSKDQLSRLQRTARREGRSVGAVIRQAIDAYTAAPPSRRQQALAHLMTLDAPVADWDVMKEEVVRSMSGGS